MSKYEIIRRRNEIQVLIEQHEDVFNPIPIYFRGKYIGILFEIPYAKTCVFFIRTISSFYNERDSEIGVEFLYTVIKNYPIISKDDIGMDSFILSSIEELDILLNQINKYVNNIVMT